MRKFATKIISAIKYENPDQTSVYQMIAENIYLNFFNPNTCRVIMQTG